tara:strand:+ start:10815 stop:11141 length:327 start_codon:yes stop_codon:yes gene_type:complete
MRAMPAWAIGGNRMKNQQENKEILVGESLPENNQESGVKHFHLKDGLNVVRFDCNAGTLHLYVRNGKLQDMTLFNAKISKKKTHTDVGGNHVNLGVKLDWEEVYGVDA